ncbi:LacI family DNA-binding transcriptional regulator [Kineococcus terrestris]|uniref:LacI family DNA-binding transcriptional regulator n=1 Tax=Kineococcus terrestris TaxID=2044856 RepID=UPI0034DACC94
MRSGKRSEEGSAAAAATLQDVARHAGVSLATASRVLNGSERQVGEALRQRVTASAAALQYSPNAQAQAMVRGRTDVVGLVVGDIADPYFASIAAGVTRAAESAGLLVTLASTGRDPGRELAHVTTLRSQRARAVLLAGSRMDDAESTRVLAEELQRFEAQGGRAAVIGQPRLPVDSVVVANERGAQDLAAALVAAGHERFAVVAGPEGLLTSRDRVAGFRRGLREHGLDVAPEHLLEVDFTRDGGSLGMRALLERGFDHGCVFAVNDVMAVGAMVALRERGVPLPGPVAVAGFDDIVTARDVTPALTTVRLPLLAMGEAAVELALTERPPTPRRRAFEGEVVLRASTGSATTASAAPLATG